MREDELRRIAGKAKVPLGTVEKDYVITLILKEISELDYFKELVFKGGTCINKMYFADARFSIDLDFTCLKEVIDKLLIDLNKRLSGKEIGNISFVDVRKEEGRQDGVRLSVGHQDMRGHKTSVKLDLSLRADIVRKPHPKGVLNIYDLPPFKLQAMVIEEMLAEKLRATITRGAPRDIYDTWFLLKKGVNFNLKLINRKLELLKRDRIFNRSLFIKSLEEKKEGWRRDLVILLPEVPPFDQVKAEILDSLRQ